MIHKLDSNQMKQVTRKGMESSPVNKGKIQLHFHGHRHYYGWQLIVISDFKSTIRQHMAMHCRVNTMLGMQGVCFI